MPADSAAIEALLDQSFEPGRQARTAYRLREGTMPDPELSFIARDDAALAGSVQYWPIELHDGGVTWPLLLLGPIAVAASHRGRGLAARLTEASLARLDARGGAPVVLIGEPGLFGRFGFDAAATGGWTLPGPVERHRLLLRPGPGPRLPGVGTLSAAARPHQGNASP